MFFLLFSSVHVYMLSCFSCVQLFEYMDLSPRLPYPWDFLGKNAIVGCHAFLLGSFQTQGSNSHLLHLLLAGGFCTVRAWILDTWVWFQIEKGCSFEILIRLNTAQKNRRENISLIILCLGCIEMRPLDIVVVLVSKLCVTLLWPQLTLVHQAPLSMGYLMAQMVKNLPGDTSFFSWVRKISCRRE